MNANTCILSGNGVSCYFLLLLFGYLFISIFFSCNTYIFMYVFMFFFCCLFLYKMTWGNICSEDGIYMQ